MVRVREKDYKKFYTRETWREFDLVAKFSESKRAKLMVFTGAGFESHPKMKSCFVKKTKHNKQNKLTIMLISSLKVNFLKVTRFRKPEKK